MKKETLLTIVVILLFLLNAGTLGFLYFRRPPFPPGAHLDRKIIEKLALNPAQAAHFELLKTAHHDLMVANENQYRTTLKSYFALLANDSVSTAEKDSLQAVLALIQGERAAVTWQHFMDVKALCTPEQRQSFEAMLPEFMEFILPARPEHDSGKSKH